MFATPLGLHETQAIISGSFISKPFDNQTFASFGFQPPIGQDSTKYSPIKTVLTLYQHQYVIAEKILTVVPIDGEPSMWQQLTWSPYSFNGETNILNKVNFSLPIHYTITMEFFRTPMEAKLIPQKDVLKSCFNLAIHEQQGKYTNLYSDCSNTAIVKSPLVILESDKGQKQENSYHFRSWCHGQPDNNIFEQQLQPHPQLPCNVTNNFHIIVNTLNLTNQQNKIYNISTISFHVQGGGVLHHKNIFNPDFVTCRVNTHFIKFNNLAKQTKIIYTKISKHLHRLWVR
eukprot:UN04485